MKGVKMKKKKKRTKILENKARRKIKNDYQDKYD